MATKQLTFDLFGRDKTASTTIRKVADSTDHLRNSIVGVGAALGAAFTIGTIVNLGRDAINAASDVNEATSAVETLFGESADSIKKFAADAATSLGTSRIDALNAAKTFGVFAQAAGLTGNKAANFSTSLVTLAGDMASFHNANPSDVISAIGSALAGEAEPLRRYGILLNDATLRAAALKAGLIETDKQALTPQQKTLAAYQVILENVGAAQGDFARTSESLANQQKTLDANIFNLQAAFGEALLPAMTELVDVANTDLIPMLADGAEWFGENVPGAIEDGINWFKQYKDEIPTVIAAVGALTVAFALMSLAMSANPLGLILLGIAGVTAALAALALDFGGFRQWLMKDVVGAIAHGIIDIVKGVNLAVLDLVQIALNALNTLFAPVNSVLAALGLPTINYSVAPWKAGVLSGANIAHSVVDLAGQLSAVNPFNTITKPASGTALTNNRAGTSIALAEGAIVRRTPGGVDATVGEGRYDELVLPLSPYNLGQLGGGSGPVVVEIHGKGVALEQLIDVRIRKADGSSEALITGGKVNRA